MKREISDYFQVVSSNTEIADREYKEFRKMWDSCARSLYLTEAPLHVDIEVTNACNLKCSMCERNMMTRKIGYMDYGLFCRIIDQCAEYRITSVKLNLWGESILHKEIFNMVRYAKKNRIHTQFNTNATLVTEENARRLVECGLDRITFSVESMVKDDYENKRRGAKFETTIKNIEDFIKIKPIGKKPLLTLQFIRMKSNCNDIPLFVDKFKDAVDFISVTNITSVDGNPEILKESMVDYKKLSKRPCPQLWLRLSVFWNGDVTVCCQDYNGVLVIGNIRDRSLKELWQSKELNALRERHKRLNFSKTLCEPCTANHKH
ncbi:MAG: radical SAM protein [Candidatus Omnitrophica bacterium]|nr:radical SAM protein [Candidatus Omnitrophota bacterium]